MKKILLDLLIVAYGASGIIGVVAYWPTIRDLFHGKPSANIPSYALWTASCGVGFLYSLIILPDLLFQIVSGLGFGSCALVLILSIRLKSIK